MDEKVKAAIERLRKYKYLSDVLEDLMPLTAEEIDLLAVPILFAHEDNWDKEKTQRVLASVLERIRTVPGYF